MSDAETSAYLLMAGGLIWVLVGIVGLVPRSRRRREENDLQTGRDPAEGEDQMTDDHPAGRPTTSPPRKGFALLLRRDIIIIAISALVGIALAYVVHSLR